MSSRLPTTLHGSGGGGEGEGEGGGGGDAGDGDDGDGDGAGGAGERSGGSGGRGGDGGRGGGSWLMLTSVSVQSPSQDPRQVLRPCGGEVQSSERKYAAMLHSPSPSRSLAAVVLGAVPICKNQPL